MLSSLTASNLALAGSSFISLVRWSECPAGFAVLADWYHWLGCHLKCDSDLWLHELDANVNAIEIKDTSIVSALLAKNAITCQIS